MRGASRRCLRLGLAAALAVLLGGCETCSYYRQAIVGQYRIVAAQRSIEDVLSAPKTSTNLQAKLRLVLQVREFADRELKLPANGHYLRYADLGRRYVVWNVHAAPPCSLEPKTWWYPVVGSVEYRGFFSERDARRYAAKILRKGLEVHVEGVEAYSTLGWFRDPVLNTFIHHDESQLAETLFHELAHQRLFVGGDTDFDEAFATTVGQEATRRWLRAGGKTNVLDAYLIGLRREVKFAELVAGARRRLEAVYTNGPSTNCVRAKAAVIAGLRRDYEQARAAWGGFSGYDAWFAQPLNNAQLNTVANYYDWVPAFQRILRESHGDLEAFFHAVETLSKLPKKERHRRMAAFLESARKSDSLP